MRLFPNPAAHQVELVYLSPEIEGAFRLECINLQGQVVHSAFLNEFKGKTNLDISKWANGIYIVKLTWEGLKIGEERLIVAH